MKKLMTLLGYDATLYSEHSGKRGGATAAAANGRQLISNLNVWVADAQMRCLQNMLIFSFLVEFPCRNYFKNDLTTKEMCEVEF
jgi:hypothetical protein